MEELKKMTANAAIRLEGDTQPAFYIVPAKMGANPEVYVETFFGRS
jgi:hypothetical protein